MNSKLETFENQNEIQYLGRRMDEEEKLSSFLLQRMIQSRKIIISSEVNQKLVDKLCTVLSILEEEDPEKPISVYINSPGGEVYSGFAIYDMMNFIRPPIRTIVMGFAASMGSILALAAHPGQRYATTNAKMLIHQPLIANFIQGTTTEIEIHAKEMLSIKDRIIHLYMEKTGQSEEKIRKDIERDYWLTAEEALDYRLIDKIIKSPIEFNPIQ